MYLYGGGGGSGLAEKPGRSVGWCLELRGAAVRHHFGVVIFQSKLVSDFLKARIALDLDRYYRPDQPIL